MKIDKLFGITIGLVCIFLNISILNGKLTALEASEGLCPAPGHVPVAEHVNYPWLLVGRQYFVPMASKHAVRKYAEVFLGRPVLDHIELDRMNLQVAHTLGKWRKMGYDREFRQLCLSESKRVRRFPRNLLERYCYIIRSWFAGEGTDVSQMSNSLDTVVWTDNHTAILVTKCINHMYYDWEVYSTGKTLLPYVRDQILDVVQQLGFSLYNVVYYDYERHKFYEEHPVVVPLIPVALPPPLPPPGPHVTFKTFPPPHHHHHHPYGHELVEPFKHAHVGPSGPHPYAPPPPPPIHHHPAKLIIEKPEPKDYGPQTYYASSDSTGPGHLHGHGHGPKVIHDHGPAHLNQLGPHPLPSAPSGPSGLSGLGPAYDHHPPIIHHHNGVSFQQAHHQFPFVSGPGPSQPLNFQPLSPAYSNVVPVNAAKSSKILQSPLPKLAGPSPAPAPTHLKQQQHADSEKAVKLLKHAELSSVYHNPLLNLQHSFPSPDTLMQYFNYPILPNFNVKSNQG